MFDELKWRYEILLDMLPGQRSYHEERTGRIQKRSSAASRSG